jgi:uncharacterized damage-inducible protein DinB
MAETQSGTRAAEVARVRGYLTSKAAEWAPAEIVEKVKESQAAVLAAAGSVPPEKFTQAPQDGEWSAAEVLHHILTVIGDSSRSVVGTIRTGVPTRVRPDRLEHLSKDLKLDDVRDLMAAEREELFATVLDADPMERLDVTVVSHPEFGTLNWREALLFVRVHDLDHARQLQAIAAAV